MAKITQKDKVDIMAAYETDLTPVIKLADRYHVTRQAIYKVLKSADIDTKKRKIPVSCTVCGVIISRTKARVREQKHHFCGYECYYAFLQAGRQIHVQDRMSQRIARKIVARYFDLQEEHIVHHEDRNSLNNDIHNLKVFACQGDHVRHHRGFEVQPLFDGAQERW